MKYTDLRDLFEKNNTWILLLLFFVLTSACKKVEDPYERILFNAMVKEKNGLPLASDSTVLQRAYHVFSERKAKPEEMRSLFYLGMGQEENAKVQIALSLFKEAVGLAEELHDPYWCSYLYSKIGFLYLKEYNSPTAQEYFDRSLQAGKDVRQDSTNIGYQLQIGRTFLFAGEPELALSYFEGIRSRVKRSDSRYTRLYRSLGIAYRDCQRYDEAITSFRESLRDEGHPEHMVICKVNMLHIYIIKKDKEQVFRLKKEVAELLPRISDLDLHQRYHRLCSVFYADDGDFEQAFEDMRLSFRYEDDKLKYLGRMSVDEMMVKKYQEKMSVENQELKAGNRWLFIVFIISWVLVGMMAYLIKKKRMRKLYDLERKIELLEDIANRSNDESEDLKNMIIRDLEIIKRIALYKTQHTRDTSFVEQFNHLVTVDKKNPFTLEWQRLYADVDRLYDGFFSQLSAYCDELTEKELQLCCLMKIGFKTDEVAAIWDQSVYSVQKYRSNIRRKLGTTEGADIILFLEEKFKK